MTDLTDAQLLFLSAAGQRDPALLLPAPKSFKGNKATATRVLNSLVRRSLAAEQPAKADEPVWREDKGQRLTLAMTAAGRKAIGLEEEAPAAPKKAAKPVASKPAAESPAARKGTKLALLGDLLRRKGGATIEEAVKATGWQPHSIRGAISGALKKKLGLAVASEAVEGRGRVYRITTRG